MDNIARKLTRNNGFAKWQANPLNINQHFTNALFFAERGYLVFPFDGQHSISHATTDIDALSEMWSTNPDAKCALALGARFGLLAMAFDDAFRDFAGSNPSWAWRDTWRMVVNSEEAKRWEALPHSWLNQYPNGVVAKLRDKNTHEFLFFRVPRSDKRLSHSKLDMPDFVVIDDQNQQWEGVDDNCDSHGKLELSQPESLPEKLIHQLVTNKHAAVLSDNQTAVLPTKEQAEAIIKEVGLTEFLAEIICNEHEFARDAGKRLYLFKDGVYVPRGDETIGYRIKKLEKRLNLTKKWSAHTTAEVVNYIGVDAPYLWEQPPVDAVNVSNGLLDTNPNFACGYARHKLRPHTPEHLSPIQLPITYDDAATCSAIDEFIQQVFPHDSTALAYELPAWLMTPDTSKQKAILLLGDGGNGKSTYLELVKAFIGKQNVWNESLHRLEHNEFAAAGLVGKLANICADLPSGYLQGTSRFKMIVGGDAITVERKNGHAFDVQLYSRLIFSANHPPRSQDSSSAFFDRWLVIPFENNFRGVENEISREVLDSRLSNPQELSGLLNRALVALLQLHRTNRFSESKSTRNAQREFKKITDPFSIWIADNIVVGANKLVSKESLRNEYAKECQRTGTQVMTETMFGKELKRIFPHLENKQRKVAGKLHWCWLGIGLKALSRKATGKSVLKFSKPH